MPSPARYLLIASFLLGGCSAYSYAGKEGESRTEPERKPSVAVVEMKEETDEDDESEESEAKEDQQDSTAPESPCGTRTFDIFYFTDDERTRKTVDCVDRAVVNVERTTMGETSYVDAKAAGLPEGVWYILVDPKGVRAEHLTNAHLLRLSREFEIEYYGRDASRDLLVYLYQDTVK